MEWNLEFEIERFNLLRKWNTVSFGLFIILLGYLIPKANLWNNSGDTIWTIVGVKLVNTLPKDIIPNVIGGWLRGVMVKAMDCRIVVSEFVLLSHYYVHFRANTLGKGMNPLILPTIG